MSRPERPAGAATFVTEFERFGLRCYGKRAARACRGESGSHPQVLVDEHGEAVEERFRGERICRATLLHGCDDEQGKEVIPFIHEGEFSPAKFSRSGFAVVVEA